VPLAFSCRLLGPAWLARSVCREGVDCAAISIFRELEERECYTPGFVLDGREWMERSVPTPSSEKPGALKLSIANGK